MNEASILCVLNLGGRWPPEKPQPLVSTETKGVVYKVAAQPAGFISLEIKDGGKVDTYCSSRIIFDGPATIIQLCWTCGDAGPRLYLDAREIPIRTDPSNERVVLISTRNPMAASLPTLQGINPEVSTGANEAETLFVRTVHELEEAAKSVDWYQLLRASGLLRLLLLDNLLHKANARVHHRPIFTTNDFTKELPSTLPKPQSHWQNLSPEIVPSVNFLRLSLDEFLEAPILHFVEGTATVKDVIKACANASGGVHFGSPRGIEETAVIQFDCGQATIGLAPSRLALRSISQITVRALHPIVAKIQEY
jgi:hypothetical protein